MQSTTHQNHNPRSHLSFLSTSFYTMSKKPSYQQLTVNEAARTIAFILREKVASKTIPLGQSRAALWDQAVNELRTQLVRISAYHVHKHSLLTHTYYRNLFDMSGGPNWN